MQNLLDTAPQAAHYFSDAFPAYGSLIYYPGHHQTRWDKSQTTRSRLTMLNFAMIWPGSLAGLVAFQGAFMPCGLLFPSSSFAGTNANFTNSASLLILPALLILWLQLFSHS